MAESAFSSALARPGLTAGGPFRVVVVEESAVIRGMMSRWLGEDNRFEVVARFGTPGGIADKICSFAPDVVILDAESSKMDGKSVLQDLLKKDKTIKVLAIAVTPEDRMKGEAALKAAGARAVLCRPGDVREVTTSLEFRKLFLTSVQSLGQVGRNDNKVGGGKPAARPARSLSGKAGPVAGKASLLSVEGEALKFSVASTVKPEILAIGSSTGGPKALYEVFEALNGKVNVPVVITQHMPPLFTGILAEHLSRASGMTAKEGVDGEKVLAGHIYVAPGDYHMILKGSASDLRIELNQKPKENYCRPSVDPMFRTVAEIFGRKALCLILTGMGQDGCEGSRSIIDAGGTLLSQDEKSSVVWGMPGAVAKAGLSAEILPLNEIGPRTASFLKGKVK